MKLQQKTALIFTGFLIVLMIVVSVFSSLVILSSYSDLEQQYTKKDLGQAVTRIEDETRTLSAIVSDWGPWDDSYNFVRGTKPGFIQANLAPETFNNIRVNVIVFAHRNGTLVYAGAYNFSSGRIVPLPEDLVIHLTPESPLLDVSDPRNDKRGIILLSDHPMIIASRPIVRTNFSGEPVGVVIMGRYLDDTEVGRLAGLTRPSLRLSLLNDSALPDPLMQELRDKKTLDGGIVRPLDRDIIAGYAILRDIYGNDALVLSISDPRSIYQQGLTTTMRFIGIILFTGLVFGLAVMVLLDRLVLSRLENLIIQVHGIGDNILGADRLEIGGEDEFSGLAREINRMLDTIDIISRKVQASETRFRELAGLLPQTIFEMDLKGNLLYVNKAGSVIFGTGDEKIRKGENVRDYMVPEDFERMQKGLSRVIAGRKSHGETYHLKKLDGTLMSASVYTGPILRNGSVIGFRGIVIDITERVILEDELRESGEKYRALTENTPDILFSTDMSGTITYASPQVNRYGFLEDEVIGKSLRVLIHPADIHQVESNLSRDRKEGAQVISQFRMLDKWGTVYWIEEKSSLRLDLSGKPIGMYGILRDVTERKRVEDAIDIANKKLNLMNQITRHDILNTITGLLGCVDMAKATPSPEEKEELLNDIRDLTRVIQRHITFTREYQEVGVHLPQWHNVNDLIKKTVLVFAKSGLTFHTEFEETEIYADPLLEKVFYNLVDNAIRYGETLTTISVYPRVSDKELSIFFEDDGVGVSPSQKHEIFKRGVGKNTGMGLFLTAEILAITGITIEENGISGTGARFEIRIPAGTWRFPRTRNKS